jgi:hypothetical protein
VPDLRVGGDLARDDDVGGNADAPTRQQLFAMSDAVFLDERVTDTEALRAQERERHRTADQQRVDAAEQRVDHAELVAHLDAAEHGNERPRRVVHHAAQCLDLAREQPAGRGRHHARRSDDRRVGAVRGAERVVDVHVAQLPEIRREPAVALLLSGVETQVLDHHHVTRLETLRPFERLEPCDIRRQAHGGAQQLGQARRNRHE